MGKGIRRGLYIALAMVVLTGIYIGVKYTPDTFMEFAARLSNSLFQVGLMLLLIGVVIFSRLFSFRRRMHLPEVIPRSRTREDYLEMKEEDEEKNIKDQKTLEEKGRDATFLVAALITIVLSILLTVNQVL